VCIENKVVLYMRKSERLTIMVNKYDNNKGDVILYSKRSSSVSLSLPQSHFPRIIHFLRLIPLDYLVFFLVFMDSFDPRQRASELTRLSRERHDVNATLSKT